MSACQCKSTGQTVIDLADYGPDGVYTPIPSGRTTGRTTPPKRRARQNPAAVPDFGAVDQLYADLGQSLVVADMASVAGYAGGPRLREKIAAFIGVSTDALPGGGLETAGWLSFLEDAAKVGKGVGREAAEAAKVATVGIGEAAGRTWKALSSGVKLAAVITAGVVAYTWLDNDEQERKAEIDSDTRLMSEQLARLPPTEAATLLAKIGPRYGASSSGTSTLKVVLYLGGGLVALGLILKAWQALGPGPGRRR